MLIPVPLLGGLLLFGAITFGFGIGLMAGMNLKETGAEEKDKLLTEQRKLIAALEHGVEIRDRAIALRDVQIAQLRGDDPSSVGRDESIN